jgi:hypothetical protein
MPICCALNVNPEAAASEGSRNVQDVVVVLEEFEETAKLGNCGVHRCAIKRTPVVLELEPGMRLLEQRDRENFFGDASKPADRRKGAR